MVHELESNTIDLNRSSVVVKTVYLTYCSICTTSILLLRCDILLYSCLIIKKLYRDVKVYDMDGIDELGPTLFFMVETSYEKHLT